MKPFAALLLSVIAGVLSVFAQTDASTEPPRTLMVFAASSLADAFTEIGAGFEAENPGVSVIFNFGGSSTLAAQLAEGAPADVFASANHSQMQTAQDAGRITMTPMPFVTNRLVLIVPADNPANIQSLHDLAAPGVKLVLAAPAVPVRGYTDAMLDKLAADADYGADYRAAVLANLVSEEDNVRQVAAKVALGEADAGIVYRSDVTPDLAEDVIALPIPDEVNAIATYPIAVTDDSAEPELARAFIHYVLTDAGQDALVKWGFTSVLPVDCAAADATLEAAATAEAADGCELEQPLSAATPAA